MFLEEHSDNSYYALIILVLLQKDLRSPVG